MPKTNVRLGWIKVVALLDRQGNATVRPVSDKHAKKFARLTAENGGPGDEDVFFQGEDAVEDFKQNIPPRKRKDFYEGWKVTFLMDPWEVGQGLYGYDSGDNWNK